ncbi:MAG: Mpo1-like protein [Gemmataceae bacterium]
MPPLAAQLSAYAAYHRDPRNKLTHVVGVPLVTFALLLALGWLRFAPAPDLPISGGTLFYLGVFLYYLRLDWRMAVVQLPLTLPLLIAAEWVARWPFEASGMVFVAAFVGGWVVQLVGHLFEGRRPALADNLLQVFNAPLFLAAAGLVRAGWRPDLKAALAGR